MDSGPFCDLTLVAVSLYFDGEKGDERMHKEGERRRDNFEDERLTSTGCYYTAALTAVCQQVLQLGYFQAPEGALAGGGAYHRHTS